MLYELILRNGTFVGYIEIDELDLLPIGEVIEYAGKKWEIEGVDQHRFRKSIWIIVRKEIDQSG
jgi:hypothetical protein